MTSDQKTQCAARLRTAFDLYEAGVDLRRCQLRREHPDLSAEEIERLLRQWLLQRPNEPHGAAPGHVRQRPLADR